MERKGIMIIIAVDSVFQLINAFNIAYRHNTEESKVLIINSKKKNNFDSVSINKNRFVEKIIYTNAKYEKHINEIIWQITGLVKPKIATMKLIGNDLEAI